MLRQVVRSSRWCLSVFLGALDWLAVLVVSFDKFFTDGSHDDVRAQAALDTIQSQGSISMPADLKCCRVPFLCTDGVDVYSIQMSSPLSDLLPDESKHLQAQLVIPRNSANPSTSDADPVDWMSLKDTLKGSVAGAVVIFPPTGDRGFGNRRRKVAIPLLEGVTAAPPIASLILQAPFYGNRRPSSYSGKISLPVIDDLNVQAVAVVLEARLLAQLATAHLGAPAVVFAGVSYGGSMASLAGLTHTEDCSVCSMLGSDSPLGPFGSRASPLSFAIDWKTQDRSVLIERLGKMSTSFLRDVAATRVGVRRAGVFINARHDQIVHCDTAGRLANDFELAEGTTAVERSELPGGHITCIASGTGAFTNGIQRALGLLRTA